MSFGGARGRVESAAAAIAIAIAAAAATAVSAAPVLHLGQGDLPRPQARRIVGDAVALGLSTHDPAQLAAARAEFDGPVELARPGMVIEP